ncbi:MAG: hypothetical protein R3336_00230 [Phycisphaeraceae bacterium]|nr:hypothetical protein [Phycisphaeraceae bacterium]
MKRFLLPSIIFAMSLVLGLGSFAPSLAQDEASESGPLDPEVIKRIAVAIQDIKEEAENLEHYGPELDRDKQAIFRRPHPALSGLGPETAVEVARRMIKSYTGNNTRDTYIRYHLIEIIKMCPEKDRKATYPMLHRLLKNLPGSVQIPMRPVRQYVPPELWRKWRRIMGKLTITRRVGYPPFQKTQRIGPPRSIEMAPEGQREALRALWEEAKEIKPQLEVIVDKDAQRFNNRIIDLNRAIRVYRGELIYEFLKTGEPEALKIVATAIVNRVNDNDSMAFDLLSYFYLAALDGVLNDYSPDLLKQAGAVFEKAARNHQGYKRYDLGPYAHGRATEDRNFADYAFHIIHLLKDPDSLQLMAPPEELNQGGGGVS